MLEGSLIAPLRTSDFGFWTMVNHFSDATTSPLEFCGISRLATSTVAVDELLLTSFRYWAM